MTPVRLAEQNHLPFIDGLRGIAILGVLATHTSTSMPARFHAPWLDYLVVSGGTGVQLFFLISAFTLYSSSRARWQQDRRPIGSFYIRRAFRILPFWWLMVAVFFGLSQWYGFPWHTAREPGGGITAGNVVSHVTFTFGFRPDWINTLVPGGWSLFCEETFYIFLPLVFRRVQTLGSAIQLLLVALGIHAAWHVARASDPDTFFTVIFPLSAWYNFAVGIVLYFVVERLRSDEGSFAASPLVDLAVLLLVPYLVDVQPDRGPLPITLGWAAFFVAAASPRSLIHRLCRLRVLQRFGVCCYSIYLFHMLVLVYTVPLQTKLMAVCGLENAPKEVRFLVWFPLVAALCYVLGTISFVCIERPSVEAGRRLVKRRNG